MRLSTRNQLSGTVSEVRHGQVTTIVKVTLGDGATVTSSIQRGGRGARPGARRPSSRAHQVQRGHAGQGVRPDP
jgi:hypothetical protein